MLRWTKSHFVSHSSLFRAFQGDTLIAGVYRERSMRWTVRLHHSGVVLKVISYDSLRDAQRAVETAYATLIGATTAVAAQQLRLAV